MAQATAPILDSTIGDLRRRQTDGCLRRPSGRVVATHRCSCAMPLVASEQQPTNQKITPPHSITSSAREPSMR